MQRKWSAIFIIIILCILLCACFACEKEVTHERPIDETTPIKLEREDITISDFGSLKTVSILKKEGVYKYRVIVTPVYDTTEELFVKYIEALSMSGKSVNFLLPDFSKYENLTLVIDMFNSEDERVADTYYYEFKYFVKIEDVILDIEDDNGIVEGITDNDYFYAEYDKNITYTKSTKNDLAIILNEDINVKSLNSPLLSEDKWSYDADKKLLIIKKSHLDQYTVGAKALFEMMYNDEAVEFYVNITNGLPLKVENNNIVYTKNIGQRLTNKVITTENKYTYLQAITIDGIYYSDCFATKQNEVIFSNRVLDSLPYGNHTVRFYFEKDGIELGYSKFNLLIQHKQLAPYNLKIDYDNKYPNVFLSWDSEIEWDEAIVTIGLTTISSKTKPNLFTKNNFNAYSYLTNPQDKVSVELIKDGTSYKSGENIYLDEDLTNMMAVSHLENKFDFIGETYNSYISNSSDLANFVAYNIVNYSDPDDLRIVGTNIVETYSIYAPYLVKQAAGDKEYIANAIYTEYLNFVEPVRAKINSEDITINGNEIIYKVHQESGGTRPYNSYNSNIAGNISQEYKEYEDVYLSFYRPGQSQRPIDYEGFKVNQVEKIAKVSTSVELYLALERGYRPVCTPNSSAERIYEKAKEILREIVDDRLDDFRKVWAIYDWISYNTVYDRGLSERISEISVYSQEYISFFRNTSFFAEGVFNYKVAQCNGIASAFSILCNIEGIHCIKTMGTVKTGNHAWNKVKVYDEWYICDATWSNARDLSIPNEYYEYITYDYFMLSAKEASSSNNRAEYAGYDASYFYAGDGQYNYWASLIYVYDGEIHDHVMQNKEEFINLLNFYTQKGETAKIAPGTTKQVSIRASSFVVKKWLENAIENNEFNHTDFEVVAFARNDDGTGNSVSDSGYTTYLRISAK